MEKLDAAAHRLNINKIGVFIRILFIREYEKRRINILFNYGNKSVHLK